MEKTTQQKALLILRIIYPIWLVLGILSTVFISSLFIVPNDATTTANNILANQTLFKLNIVVENLLTCGILFLFAAFYLYKLFEPVNKDQAMLMLILALVSVPISMLSALNSFAALNFLDNPSQMMFFLNLNTQGITIASIFFGLWLFPLGYLIYKSGYFPKFVGIAVIIGGVGYTLDSFFKLVLPNTQILSSIFEIMILGEIVFLVWLLFKGAKLPKTNTTKRN